ncbi:hypothetical protein D3C77_674590 [compost metagenome]
MRGFQLQAGRHTGASEQRNAIAQQHGHGGEGDGVDEPLTQAAANQRFVVQKGVAEALLFQ